MFKLMLRGSQIAPYRILSVSANLSEVGSFHLHLSPQRFSYMIIQVTVCFIFAIEFECLVYLREFLSE